MCHPGIDEYGVALTRVERRAISTVHRDVRVGGEVRSRPIRQHSVDLTGEDASTCASYFGQDRRVITDAAAQVINAVASLEVKGIDPSSQRTRLPVVQITGWIKGNQNIVIKVSRIFRC